MIAQDEIASERRCQIRVGQEPIFEIKGSLLHIPDVPGVGLEWNEEVVKANLASL